MQACRASAELATCREPLRFMSSAPSAATEAPAAAGPATQRGGVREVFNLAVPAVLTQLSMTAMGIIDSAMVGRLGATELAAVGFAGVWIWTSFDFFFGTASAAQTFVAQAWGAERQRECGSWTWQGLYLLVPTVVGVALAVGVAIGPLLAALGPSQEMQGVAARYVVPLLCGVPGIAIAFVISSFFRGLGDTRTPLYAALVANLCNAVLDYGLIFGKLGLPELGVAGAGIATAIGQWIHALYLFIAFRRRSVRERYATDPARPDLDQMRRFVRTGAPIGGQWVLGMLSFAIFATVIARMGDAPAAASQAFVVLLSVSFMQALGISAASSTLVGRYIGADDLASARRSFRSSEKLAGVLAAVIALLFIAAPELLMRIFSDDPEVIRLGRSLVIVGSAYQFCDAFGVVAEGALRGAGDTRWPFVVHALFSWGLFLPAAWLLGVTLEGGVVGAWVGGVVYVAALATALVRRFHSGAWQSITI